MSWSVLDVYVRGINNVIAGPLYHVLPVGQGPTMLFYVGTIPKVIRISSPNQNSNKNPKMPKQVHLKQKSKMTQQLVTLTPVPLRTSQRRSTTAWVYIL